MSSLLFKGGKRKILRSYLWKLVEKSYENTKKMYQTEPLDLSVRGKSKILSVIDFKFLAGLNDHLAKLYERTTFVDKSMGSNPRGVKTVLPCQVCFKTFDRPSLLKRHMRTHTGEKPHVCNVCSKGFSTSSSLNTHRRIHTGEKPHKCPDCGKCFTASSNLYYHRMTHTKNKPHKCMWCPRSFPTPGELRAHVTSHDLYNNKYAELQQNRHRQVKFDYNK